MTAKENILNLRGGNVYELFNKHRTQIADISIHRAMKKWSLLEEIQGSKEESNYRGENNRPIIVVPSSEYQGNICLKNSVSFLSDGKYIEAPKVEMKGDDKYS